MTGPLRCATARLTAKYEPRVSAVFGNWEWLVVAVFPVIDASEKRNSGCIEQQGLAGYRRSRSA